MDFTVKFMSVQGMPLSIGSSYFGTDLLTKLMIIKELSIDDIPTIDNYVPREYREHTIIVKPSDANNIPAFKLISTVLVTVPESALNLIAELKMVNKAAVPFIFDIPPHFVWTVDDEILMDIWKDTGYDSVIDPDCFQRFKLDMLED